MSNPYARRYITTSSDRASRKEAMRQQLQENPQLIQQLQTVVKTPDDVSILTELLGEMNINTSRGGKRMTKTRTNRRRTLKRKRRL